MQLYRERTNIHVAYALSFIGYIYFPTAAWLLFYMRYLTYAEVAMLAAIGGIATILFEIPTGAFADIVGRRKSLILCFFIYAIIMFIEAYSTTFFTFAVIAVLGSLLNSLYSGSLEALVYDTLKEDGKENTYDKVVSKIESFSWMGLFTGALLGGFMYTTWFRLPFIAQGILMIFSTFLAMAFVEPIIDSKKYKLSDILLQNIQGFRELFHNSKVSHISLLFILLESAYFISAALLGISQATEYGLDARGISILFATGYLLSAAVSYYYPQIRQKLGTNIVLFVSTILLLSSFFFAKFVGLIVGSILIIARIASSTLASNTRSVIINRHITSKNRATSISTLTLLSHLPFALSAYVIGLYIEQNSPNDFAFILGIIVSILLILHIISSRYHKN